MKVVFALVFAGLLALVHSETCSISSDCKITICSGGNKVICGSGRCTCAEECHKTDTQCFTRDQCLRDDPCSGNGGCPRNSMGGRPDYHCYDNRCWCGFPTV